MEELGECPNCTEEVLVIELDIFSGICENCFEKLDNIESLPYGENN